jgi:ribonuclease HI
MNDSETLTIYTDGAARGNPGPAAYSYVIHRPDQPAIEDHGSLGETTNNIAEYTALVKALQRARELGGRRVAIHSDSELMVKQMLGDYKVKHDGLKTLYAQAQQLARDFEEVTYTHVFREENKRADQLCNLELDAGSKPAAKKRDKSAATAGPQRTVPLAQGAREEILECLRSVACVWSAGNPNHPRPEEVWEQLWTILEDAGVLKTVNR